MGIRILLVEGDDDQHVVWNLQDARGLPKDAYYVAQPGDEPNKARPGKTVRAKQGGKNKETSGGDSRLLESIPARLVTSELECLAIILDADEKGPEARWDSVRQRLIDEGYENNLLPKDLAVTGTVIDLPSRKGRTPIRFAVWIMPDNQSTGMLEDFVAGMIDESDAMLSRVDGFLASIRAEQRRYSDAHAAKARLHTWLAVSERPGRPMGQAIKADSRLNANHSSVAPFLDWLRRALVD